jgi:phage I-like protein
MWDSGDKPEWIQLLPLGPAVEGRDGRAWTMSDADAVVAATELPLVLDWEHATEIKAPKGDEAPAAGWIVELSVVREESAGRTPGVWGRVDWTPRGASSVGNHEYRYQSPVFQFQKGSDEVLRLLSAALTNRPNLDLTALNRRDERQQATPPEESNVMNPEQMKALCAALGLPADSSVEAIVAAAQNATSRVSALAGEVTALNARVSNLVTREDLETALNRARVAEEKLATVAKEQHASRVEAALNAAQTEGKISPGSRVHYLAMCSDAAGLERFNALVETLPALCQDDNPRKPETGDKQGTGSAANTLSEEDKAAAKALNISEERFLARKTALHQEQV